MNDVVERFHFFAQLNVVAYLFSMCVHDVVQYCCVAVKKLVYVRRCGAAIKTLFLVCAVV